MFTAGSVAPPISVLSKEHVTKALGGGGGGGAKGTGADADAEVLMQRAPLEGAGPGPSLPLHGCPGETLGSSQKRTSTLTLLPEMGPGALPFLLWL